MLVAVTGASGLIGTALGRRLEGEGHQVLRLTRSRPTGPGQVRWDPAAGRLDPDALAEWAVRNWKVIGSPGFALDEEIVANTRRVELPTGTTAPTARKA